MGRGLAFGGKVGGQNDFTHLPVTGTLEEFLQADVLGSDPVERTQPAHQHKIQATVSAGALHRRLISRGLNHAQLGGVALRVQAGCTNIGLGKSVAALAMADFRRGLRQGAGEAQCTSPIMLEQMEGHPRSRLHPDPGQTP